MLSNSFYEMAVKSKPTADYYLKMLLAVCIIILAVLTYPLLGYIALFILVVGVYIFITFESDRKLEYEYEFTEGNVEIAAIYNSSKRKELFSFDMEQVSMITPKNSLRLDGEMFDKKRDYTSKGLNVDKDGNAINQVICLVVKRDDNKQLVIIEPDKRAMEHIKTYAKNKMYLD